MKNILYLCNEYPISEIKLGGIGKFVSLISKEISKKYKVYILGFNENLTENYIKKINQNLIIIFLKPDYKTFYGKLWYQYFKWSKIVETFIEQKKIDIVEYYDWELLGFGIDFKVKSVCRLHSSSIIKKYYEKNKFIKYLFFNTIKKADKLVAVSEFMKTEYLKYFTDITVIPNPISEIFFDISNHRQRKKQIIFTGTISKHKGIIELVKVFIDNYDKLKDYKLLVFGKAGNCFLEFVKLIKKYDNIIWFDEKKEKALKKYYDESLLAVFPSYYESEGVAVKEAAAAGLFLLLNNIKPFKDNFKELESVFFNVNDKKDFENKLFEVLDVINTKKIPIKKNIEIMTQYKLNQIVKLNIKLYEML